MIIKDFTEPELDYFREKCHFVGDESLLFELRCNGLTLEEAAEVLDRSVDGVKKISRKINKKIMKVL